MFILLAAKRWNNNNKCDFAQADGNKNGVSAVVDKSLVGAIANLLWFVDAPTSTTFSSICHANLIRRKPIPGFFALNKLIHRRLNANENWILEKPRPLTPSQNNCNARKVKNERKNGCEWAWVVPAACRGTDWCWPMDVRVWHSFWQRLSSVISACVPSLFCVFNFIFNAFLFIRLSREYFSFRFTKMLNYNRVVFASVARFLLPQHRLYAGRSRKHSPWSKAVLRSKRNPGLDQQLRLKQELDIDYEAFEDFAENEADFTQLHKVMPSSKNSDCETVYIDDLFICRCTVNTNRR